MSYMSDSLADLVEFASNNIVAAAAASDKKSVYTTTSKCKIATKAVKKALDGTDYEIETGDAVFGHIAWAALGLARAKVALGDVSA